MKFILRTTDVVAAARIVTRWQKEHEGYYGKPCGFRHIYDPPGSANWVDNLGYRQVGEHVHQWLTAGRNRLRVEFESSETALLSYEGRRHGLKDFPVEVLRNCERVVYETTRPDWEPWETADFAPTV